MAMMISKFHRLIQNKITWWVVLTIIVFSFVIWGSQSWNKGSSGRRQMTAAMLENKPVEHEEYRQAYACTHLGLVLQYNREINITPQIDEIIRKQSWQRVAALREAEKLGITASDDEVAGMMQQLPLFRTKEGQFSMQAYEQFVGQILPRMGFTKHGFDEFVRQEIMMEKCAMMVSRLMFVSPYDTRRTYQALNDRFVAEYAMLTPDMVEKTVKTGRDEAKALFDKDPMAYKIPERAVVRYVTIPVSNFVAAAEVKDEEVQKYYNDHLEEFALPSTNAMAATNEFSTETTKYKQLEEVKPGIVKSLKQQVASVNAMSNATAFIEAVQGSASDKPMSFDDAAKKFGFTIDTTKPFSEMDEVEGLKVGTDFNHVAFGLSNEEGGNVSEPVKGRDAWYVLAYKERLPEKIPSFEEVLDKVIPDAKQQAIEDALVALAKKTRDAMDAAAKAGQSVADAAQKLGVKLTNTVEFTASGGENQNVEHFDALIRGILPHNQGEVTDPLPSPGGILVAHIKSRMPADPVAFQQLRPQIANSIRRQQGRQLFDGWQQFLLKRGKFEDLLKKATEDAKT